MPVFNLFNSIEPQCVWAKVSVCVESAHTPKAVGSRHLCFKSQHSYYGFHVACKVLCICFDQSLFGMPSHIKMLGIHLLGTYNPCKACLILLSRMAVSFGIFCDNHLKKLNRPLKVKAIFKDIWHGAASLIAICNRLVTAAVRHFHKRLNFLLATNFCFSCMCLTFVPIPQEEKPLLFTFFFKICTALYP